MLMFIIYVNVYNMLSHSTKQQVNSEVKLEKNLNE